MKTPHDDIFQEVRRYRPSDWTVTFLWIALFASVTMVTGTLMWNLGKSMRVESYLKAHSIETCQALHQPPAQMTSSEAQSPVGPSCERIVSQRHTRCLERTAHFEEQLKERREDYMTCIMEHDSQRAALDDAQDDAPTN